MDISGQHRIPGAVSVASQEFLSLFRFPSLKDALAPGGGVISSVQSHKPGGCSDNWQHAVF